MSTVTSGIRFLLRESDVSGLVQVIGIVERWNLGIMEKWNDGIVECWNNRTMEYCNVGQSIFICTESYFPIFRLVASSGEILSI